MEVVDHEQNRPPGSLQVSQAGEHRPAGPDRIHARVEAAAGERGPARPARAACVSTWETTP